ncbi:MAG: NAD-dependent epimerase/dehydratase family protein [Rhizomicrobium sp.]|jgi:nucleoside-diphosphate-sugar epimerase
MTERLQGNIALLGATGAIGKSAAAALSAEGTPFRAIGRDEAGLAKLYSDNSLAQCVSWNPDDPASIRRAFSGVSTLVYLLGVPYNQFRLHPILMKRVIESAVGAGVERILLIGTLYVFGRARTKRITEEHPRKPNTFKGRMRKSQEDLLMAADAKGRLKASVLRLPDFYGPDVEGSLLRDLFLAAASGRRANMIGPLDTPHEFVFVPDVGPVVAKMLRTEAAFGRCWNLGGAGAITQRELATMAFGDEPPRLRVAGKMALRLLGLFNPMMRELVEMNYLLTDPLIVDDTALAKLLGSIQKTSYRDGVSRSMEWAKQAVQAR